jgi:TonB family protein
MLRCVDVNLRVFLALIAGFQIDSWRGGVVFSKIVWVALISLLGSASVFCQGAPQDASQADTTESKPKALQVGANVEAAQLIRQVAPVYPPIAKTAHISGTVVLHAIIGKDGTVEDLQFVSGPPLLLKSAMDAVKQWQYKPTLLMGEPVRVDTTISVVYQLDVKNRNNAAESSEPPGAADSSAEPAGDTSRDAAKDASASQDAASVSVPANPPAPKPIRMRLGGTVALANLVHRVSPVYPQSAKDEHIQGTVLLHAVIALDGTIQTLEYVSGPAELMDSAMNAIKQWRYKPTLLNGQPVEVDTTIAVVYTLK